VHVLKEMQTELAHILLFKRATIGFTDLPFQDVGAAEPLFLVGEQHENLIRQYMPITFYREEIMDCLSEKKTEGSIINLSLRMSSLNCWFMKRHWMKLFMKQAIVRG
jgi:hypothetical protein